MEQKGKTRTCPFLHNCHEAKKGLIKIEAIRIWLTSRCSSATLEGEQLLFVCYCVASQGRKWFLILLVQRWLEYLRNEELPWQVVLWRKWLLLPWQAWGISWFQTTTLSPQRPLVMNLSQNYKLHHQSRCWPYVFYSIGSGKQHFRLLVNKKTWSLHWENSLYYSWLQNGCSQPLEPEKNKLKIYNPLNRLVQYLLNLRLLLERFCQGTWGHLSVVSFVWQMPFSFKA